MGSTAGLHLGIDASNLRAGGGLTHIAQVLASGDPTQHGISRVTIWAGNGTLARIVDRPWLTKVHVRALDKPLPFRAFWQKWLLPKALKQAGCDALFSPGGVLPAFYDGPGIIMSQNLLPFEKRESRRAPFFSFHRFKISLVRMAQLKSHRKADGIVFLSQYARNVVVAEMGHSPRNEVVIPHGLELRFFGAPRIPRAVDSYSHSNPIRVLYVSTVFYYKHPWNVADAAGELRRKGYPLSVEFVGDGLPEAISRLNRAIGRNDPKGEFLFYRGGVPFDQIHQKMREADLFVFASSCETIASTVLEAMASGLPIASSNRGPLPEVLGSDAMYFDPERCDEIAGALESLIQQPELRSRLASGGQQRARQYSWQKCSNETFSFLFRVINSTITSSELK
jgi:glycosyltransferase involved in cell wall biosynthesis